MREIPDVLRDRPFSRAEALAAGVTSRMLDGTRFVRVHEGVWRVRDHVMTDADWLAAARLALPARAHLTGISRLQQLGLDFGPCLPVRFVVEGDLHRELRHVFLHRTTRLAPHDDDGVSVAAAYIAYCALARVVDAIKVGDWLLHHDHLGLDELRALAWSARWRDGALEALWVSNHLDHRSRSLKESETRAVLELAGLPCPEVNAPVPLTEAVTVIADLYYVAFRATVEYQGRQHLEDPLQVASDIDRYAALRRGAVPYVQATSAKLNDPRRLVGEVHAMLVDQGTTARRRSSAIAGSPCSVRSRARWRARGVTSCSDSPAARSRDGPTPVGGASATVRGRHTARFGGSPTARWPDTTPT